MHFLIVPADLPYMHAYIIRQGGLVLKSLSQITALWSLIPGKTYVPSIRSGFVLNTRSSYYVIMTAGLLYHLSEINLIHDTQHFFFSVISFAY